MKQFIPPPLFIKTTSFVAILFSFISLLSSCKKDSVKQDTIAEEQKSIIKPNTPQCPDGYHWDFTLLQCVPDCPSGYEYCPATGGCVPTGSCSSGNITATYAGVTITCETSNNILRFNSSNDVNTVLNQLDIDYDNYNDNYDNQYPNYTAEQLDSIDIINNFD